MSVHSTSAAHSTSADPTSPAKRAATLLDVARLLAGAAAGVVSAWGSIQLAVHTVSAATAPMTQSEAAHIAAAATMAICGLIVAVVSVVAQRAADRRAEQQAKLTAMLVKQHAIVDDQQRIATRLDALATERGQEEHSTRTRADVAKIQEDLTEMRLGQTEMAQRMPVEETLLATLKAYIDALFKAFREHEDEAVAEADAGGYVRGVRTRVNGAKKRLQGVDLDR